jgi:Uncharacterized conserved protein
MFVEQAFLDVSSGGYIYRCDHRIMEGDCQVDHGPRFAEIPALQVQKYPVTNHMYACFLKESGYHPADKGNFLTHFENGIFPLGMENHPVVWVSYLDALAYAHFYGLRLPTDEEWQYLAAGPQKRRWPWGNDAEPDEKKGNIGGGILTPVNTYPQGASPFGIFDMCGNAYEMMGPMHDDGMHRFLLLRGGSCYKAPHFWHAEGGPQPNDAHLKMPLLNEALNRSGFVGFRCVREVRA